MHFQIQERNNRLLCFLRALGVLEPGPRHHEAVPAFRSVTQPICPPLPPNPSPPEHLALWSRNSRAIRSPPSREHITELSPGGGSAARSLRKEDSFWPDSNIPFLPSPWRSGWAPSHAAARTRESVRLWQVLAEPCWAREPPGRLVSLHTAPGLDLGGTSTGRRFEQHREP